jgi:hypothetical protein
MIIVDNASKYIAILIYSLVEVLTQKEGTVFYSPPWSHELNGTDVL